MSRDRQIAVAASIFGLAGLIIGIVALSQDSGADDEWVRNRALPGDSEATVSAASTSRSDERQIRELSDRLERLEERQVAESQESTDDPSRETAADREAIPSDRDNSDLGAAQSAAVEEADDRDEMLFEYDTEDSAGNPAEEVIFELELDEEDGVGDEIGDEVEGEVGDQAGAWASQDEAQEDIVGALRQPEDPSAVQSGTLQSFSANGVPAFIEHFELGATIPEMKYLVESKIGILSVCNYLVKDCLAIDDDYFGDLWTDDNSWVGAYMYDTIFETDVVSDEYLTYELRCPNVANLVNADSDDLPSIGIRRNNKYSSYAYSSQSARTPWPGFPLQESIALESWEKDGDEFSLLKRPWITTSQRDLRLMYEWIYDAAQEDGSYQYSSRFSSFNYPWGGWLNAKLYGIPYFLENLGAVYSASELYVNALDEYNKQPNKTVINNNIELVFWDHATKASLAYGVEQWPPPDGSFWAKTHDLIEYVPTRVGSRSVVRIHDPSSGEYHWSLITADLTYHNSDQEGDNEGQRVGHCGADISITRSYK